VLSLRTKPDASNGTNGTNGNGKHTPADAEAPRALPERNNLYCADEVRILVIDDDDVICRLVQGTLDQSGFVIDTISDPAGIEARLQERSYHVVILDYFVPSLQPEQILEWLRVHQPEASVIVVTAYPSYEGALNCLRARAYDYLAKPFETAHLQRIVTRCLEGKGLLRLSVQALRESLGTAIRERRKALGLTLAQMASRTGVSLGYLSQIELGKNSASIETLYCISLGLGVKMADLFLTVQPRSD
jgi:CheY-like chemotaxis protein